MFARRFAHRIPIGRQFWVFGPHLAGRKFLDARDMDAHAVLDFAHRIKAVVQGLQARLLLSLPSALCFQALYLVVLRLNVRGKGGLIGLLDRGSAKHGLLLGLSSLSRL